MPRWTLAIALALAAIQPCLLLWISYAPPAGMAPTGLHLPDSAIFLQSMRAAESGLYSPYATCQSDFGDHGFRLYAVPHLWLYLLTGKLAGLLHSAPLLLYGLLNGLCLFLYLLAVRAFLWEVSPAHATIAFVLFALSSGPGGVLFILTRLSGVQASPQFDTYFFRFGLYDLMEGPHLNPALYAGRAYYTLSLALCFGGLAAVVRSTRSKSLFLLLLWVPALALGSFINARFGLFSLGVLAIWLSQQTTLRDGVRSLVAFALPVALGVIASILLMRTNPVVIGNHQQLGSMAMWFSSFLIASGVPLSLSARPVAATISGMHAPWRAIAIALTGYLVAYALLYVLYQAYYGNLLNGHDGSVAAAISDWALAGALVGGLLGLRGSKGERDPVPHAWVALWLLLYLAVSISGWGQGWFLRFGPQRLEVFLWLPLCLLAAQGVAAFSPPVRRGMMTVLLVCGASSITVSTLYFQGPLGQNSAAPLYPSQHAEAMLLNDARLIQKLGEGTVLAPAPMSDVIAWRRRNPVVFGVGSFNLTAISEAELRAEVHAFFTSETPGDARARILDDWCVDYVYCPETWPVEVGVVEALLRHPDLTLVASEGAAHLFKVKRQVPPRDSAETAPAAMPIP